jgi:hypothetical protein
VAQATLNASAPQTYYTTFDLASYNTYSDAPRIFKKVTYTPTPAQDGTQGIFVSGSIQTFPVWTAIIVLDRGKPTSIKWDEGCFFCATNGPSCVFSSFDAAGCDPAAANFVKLGPNASSVCSESPDSQKMSCFSDHATCYPGQNGLPWFAGQVGGPFIINVSATAAAAAAVAAGALPSNTPTPSLTPTATPSTGAGPIAPVVVPDTSCDLKIFVVWDGTDKNGNVLKSVNRRFSVYRSFSVATAFQSALNVAQQGLDIANTVGNVAQGLPGQLTPGANERQRNLGELMAEMGEAGKHAVSIDASNMDPPLPGVRFPQQKRAGAGKAQ